MKKAIEREHVLSRDCWCRPKAVKPRHSWLKDPPRSAGEWFVNLYRKHRPLVCWAVVGPGNAVLQCYAREETARRHAGTLDGYRVMRLRES